MKPIVLFTILILIHISLFGQILGSNLDSTKTFQPDSIEVKVIVDFAVMKSGEITDIKVTSVDCQNCSEEDKNSYKEEALRIMNDMPAWKPKKKVRKTTYFTLPLVFKLEK